MSHGLPTPKRNWRLAFAISLSLHALGIGLAIVYLHHHPKDAPRGKGSEKPTVVFFEMEVDMSKPGTDCYGMAEESELSEPILVESPTKPTNVETEPVNEPTNASNASNHENPQSTEKPVGTYKPGDATTTFFGMTTTQAKIVYVVDGSASMAKNGAFRAAQQQLLASVKALPVHCQVQVVLYHSQSHYLLPTSSGWMKTDQAGKQQIRERIGKVYPEGSTVHEKALPLALALRPDVIYFLTDGEKVSQQYLNTVSQANSGRAVIHVIELCHSPRIQGGPHLARFAQDNGGMYQAFQVGP